ncbi:uncharacterized protein KIAA1841 homolog, partial [Pollicipes pollicipes]|uniref:uncharacterized protein KIAA1841 homolog n=1 Tax=Pollicipes pollicipes TaxID=41117 RepID=UPI0018857F46
MADSEPPSVKPREKGSSGRSKKRDTASKKELHLSEPDVNITIQVMDEALKRSQEFACPKAVLLEHMPYFRDVVKGQKLENVDITIHCELTIFDWLICWVQSQSVRSAVAPTLTADSVLSVLSSADFLRMDRLVDECFEFVRADPARVTDRPGVTCLNERLMARLATLFHHDRVEALAAHDRLRGRLYCQLTALLFECVARNLSVTPDGRLAYLHRRDRGWELGAHVARLRRELRSWRLVYWRLWAAVHFLWCARCERPFAASQLGGCLFHPEPTALQFDPLQTRSGCLLRDHLVEPAPGQEAAAAQAVYRDLQAHRSLAVEPGP